MTISNEYIINYLLNHKSSALADVGVHRNMPKGSIKNKGYGKFSKMFCDSLVFWGLYNTSGESSKGETIGKYIAELRETFTKESLPFDSIKTVNTGVLQGDEYFSERRQAKFAKGYRGEPFCAGYIAIKVSLQHCRAKKVVLAMESVLPTLEKKYMVLHDIDMTRDCRYVSNRSNLEACLEANGVCTIINDRTRVGDHCVSWMGGTHDTGNIRYKVYNKFVQMLESAEVRKSLGSRMEDLVSNGDEQFTKRLLKHKDHGFSRLELTFYGRDLLSLMEYHDKVNNARELLSKCTTFKCSYEMTWTQRAQLIKSMVAVYIPERKIFAYCHWWNSITSKKYGYMWKNVSQDLAMHLLANYSFNDRPIHYIQANIIRDGSVEITKETVYQREPGCKAMTLVPGGGKGMFPSRKEGGDNVMKFPNVGIVHVDNIRIGWPKKAHRKTSAPLAVLVRHDGTNSGETYVMRLGRVHSTSYVAGYNILEPGKEYTIAAAGLTTYRGVLYWHIITECGVRIRAGKSLNSIWEAWRGQYLDDHQAALVDKIPRMRFRAVCRVRSQGKNDMKCVMA